MNVTAAIDIAGWHSLAACASFAIQRLGSASMDRGKGNRPPLTCSQLNRHRLPIISACLLRTYYEQAPR